MTEPLAWPILLPVILFFVWGYALWKLVKFLRDEAKEKDEMMLSQQKHYLADQIMNMVILFKAGANPLLLCMFNFTLDGVFGRRHFSWHCFWRSAVISVSSFMLLVGVMMPERFIDDGGWLDLSSFAGAALAGAILNLFGDYVSLAETRWLLRHSGPLYMRLGIDAIATVAIWLTTILCVMLIIRAVESDFNLSVFNVVLQTLEDVMDGLYRTPDPFGTPLLWCSLLTTFTTSVWLWFHVAAAVVLGTLANNVLHFEHKIKEYPYRTLVHVFTGWIVVVGLAGYIVAYHFGWSS